MENFTFLRLSVAFLSVFWLSTTFHCLLNVFRFSAAFQKQLTGFSSFQKQFSVFCITLKTLKLCALKFCIYSTPYSPQMNSNCTQILPSPSKFLQSGEVSNQWMAGHPLLRRVIQPVFLQECLAQMHPNTPAFATSVWCFVSSGRL